MDKLRALNTRLIIVDAISAEGVVRGYGKVKVLENLDMCVESGSFYGLSKQKRKFATNRRLKTLSDAMNKADVFIGLSVGNVVTQKMLKTMSINPIVFRFSLYRFSMNSGIVNIFFSIYTGKRNFPTKRSVIAAIHS